MNAARTLSAAFSGVLFGFGLALSGMLDPSRVLGFLDVFGAWDPSLAFVLAGAVAVAAVAAALARTLPRPAFDAQFHLPDNRRIDAKLLAGAAIFGVGWGVAGLCPGPAVASAAIGVAPTLVFLFAMLAGMAFHDAVLSRPAPDPSARAERRLR